MLGLMKLGAVVMPTTTAVGSAELADRIDRGAARAVICDSGDASKVDDVPRDYLRIAVGSRDTRTGRLDLTDAYPHPEDPVVHPAPGPVDHFALHFPPGTTPPPHPITPTTSP